MMAWWVRLVCRLHGHRPRYERGFLGGTVWSCRRCGATGESFEFCPSERGQVRISWRVK